MSVTNANQSTDFSVKTGAKDYLPVFAKCWENALRHPSNSLWSRLAFLPKFLIFVKPVFDFNKWWFGTFWMNGNDPIQQIGETNVYYGYTDACCPRLFGLTMTIVKGSDGSLLLFNFIPAVQETIEQVRKLGGPVKYLFVASCTHDNFVDDWRKAFPTAKLIGDANDKTHLEESFPMNGYWQDQAIAAEFKSVYGLELFAEIGFAMPPIDDFADQVAVITTIDKKNTVMIAPHLFSRREPTAVLSFQYFYSWLVGYQGEPFCENFKFCYVADKKGICKALKRYMEQYKPVAVIGWHSRAWVGAEEIVRLVKMLS